MTGQGNGNERLVGWLVSYGLDENGYSYELRSGLSFISAQGVGDFRLLSLNENTVSSPHAALKACPKHSVHVQDIFSEHGSYLVRGGKEEETRIDGPVELHHGDWIRVGESTRFQVCLIDGAGN